MFPDRGQAGCSVTSVLRMLRQHGSSCCRRWGFRGCPRCGFALGEEGPSSGVSPWVVQLAGQGDTAVPWSCLHMSLLWLGSGWDLSGPPQAPSVPREPSSLQPGCGGEGVHPVLQAASCPRVSRSTGDPRVAPGCLLSSTSCRRGCGSPYHVPFLALLFSGVTQGQGQAGDFREQSCQPCFDMWQWTVFLLFPAKCQPPGPATLLTAHGGGCRDDPGLVPAGRLNHGAQHCREPWGGWLGSSQGLFSPSQPC